MRLCGFEAGLDQPLFLIAGPCAIESRQMALDTAGELKAICAAVGVPFIYKSSFDKANRSSDKSFRGVGMDEGLEILADVKKTIGVRYSCPADRAHPAAGSANSYRCWRARQWRAALQAYSWKPIRIPPRRCPTGRMPGRWRTCGFCLRRLWRSMPWSKRMVLPNNLLLVRDKNECDRRRNWT